MSNLTTLPKGDSAWLFRKAIERIIQQISDLETNIGSSTTGNSANTQIIFNDNGVLRGDPDLTFNTALNKLVVNNIETAANLLVGTSATITGDLTVRTNKLAVTSTGVAVGATSAAYPLDVTGIINTNSDAYVQGGRLALYRPAGASYIDIASGQDLVFRGGLTTVGGAGASDLMRLNSTGLGVGGGPSYKLDVQGTSAGVLRLVNINNLSTDPAAVTRLSLDGQGATWHLDNERTNGIFKITRNSTACLTIDNSANVGIGVASPDFKFAVNGTQAVPDTTGSSTTNGSLRIGAPGTNLVIDTGVTAASAVYGWIQARSRTDYSSNYNLVLQPNGGNVGIGVTPSAWWSSTKALQISSSCSLVARTDTASRNYLASNAYLNSTPSWTYLASNTAAARYDQNDGSHQWHIAPSSGVGGANTAITFTQAMTLAANGQLLLGTTATSGVVDTAMVMDKSSGSGFVGNVYRMGGVDKGYSYLSSASASMLYETVTGYVIRMVSATNGVYLANGGTSWLTLSDERNKDIIEPISNAVAKVGSLRSVIGKFKSEAEGTRRSFLIAQDVQAVLPEAVDSTNPNELAVSYTEVIPLLVAAIKELTARVQTLETR